MSLINCYFEFKLTLDFEVVPNSKLDRMNVSEIQEMLEQMYKLPRQPGLDAQGFLCKSCQHPLGIGYTNFQCVSIIKTSLKI